MFDNTVKLPRALLIAVHQNFARAKEDLKELKSLVETYQAEVVKEFIQTLKLPDTKTYIGKGKCEEIKNYIKENQIDLCIFDDDLTPSQTKNIEKALECKILDRSMLILEIFSNNAKTSQAKVQVELAKSQYLLPRLTRMWTHLERQRGGIGSKSGAGEKEIETDKRIIKNRIALLKNQLKEIEKNADIQRKNRQSEFRVTLVGYTNAGKSSLMNLIAKSDVLSENKLFATLDTTVRKVQWKQTEFLLADTVGFIKKLPHHLIESFKSTLNEVKDANLLLHVVDASHPQWEEHIQTVHDTLISLNAHSKPNFLILNKCDLLSPNQIADIEVIVNSLNFEKKIYISTKDFWNLSELKDLIVDFIKSNSWKKNVGLY
jgi:GTP-binding protein HflX